MCHATYNLNRVQFVSANVIFIFRLLIYFFCICSYGDFQAYTRQKKHKTYILKPESGCQGRGIWVTKNPKEIKPHEHMLCQQYISKVTTL